LIGENDENGVGVQMLRLQRIKILAGKDVIRLKSGELSREELN
jgi:hypothetical protein